jgi:nucleoside-diphosphate-sugar epimerase
MCRYSIGMKVHVTGASGFVGRGLMERIGASAPLADADAIVHLAGIAHRRASREELRRVNVDLAVETAKKAAAAGASFLFISTAKVHGEEGLFSEKSPIAPKDPYAESKARAEDALRAIPGLRLTVLRPPLVYGPGVTANFLSLMKAVASGIPLPFASIENRRSFVFLGNLVDAIVNCLGRPGTFLVSDGVAISTPNLCRELAGALGRPARLFAFPPPLLPAKLAASLALDDSLIRREWKPPFSLEAGLAQTAAWYRQA